jgi:hypothetical protein
MEKAARVSGLGVVLNLNGRAEKNLYPLLSEYQAERIIAPIMFGWFGVEVVSYQLKLPSFFPQTLDKFGVSASGVFLPPQER